MFEKPQFWRKNKEKHKKWRFAKNLKKGQKHVFLEVFIWETKNKKKQDFKHFSFNNNLTT